jgi:large subunit ribosomal protein L25
MEVTKLPATKRAEKGKRHVVRVREAGRVPAVVYGMTEEPLHVSVDARDVERELRLRHRVFRLEVEGGEQPVYLKDLQLNALTDEPVHIDFLRIDLQKPMHVEVELTFVGIPAGASKGGVLVRDRSRVKLRSLPAAIPLEIEVKVGAVDIGDQIRAADLALPDGVELDMPGTTIVCHMTE